MRPTPDQRPAGFWRRAVALAVALGVVLVGVCVGLLVAEPLRRYDLVAGAFRDAWLLVLPGAYFVLCHGTTGQTAGKWLVGARLVRANGAPVGYGRAIVRLLVSIPVAVLVVGFLVVAWRRDRRGWHDRLAGTWVLRLS